MRSSNTYVQLDSAVIEQARQIDLLMYLKSCEPNNLKRISQDVYCTVEHDSLKMSNGKWFWWSRGFGGKNAIDYLIKVKQYSFQDAVLLLTGGMTQYRPPSDLPPKEEEKTEKKLLLPPKNESSDKVVQYLSGRGIDLKIIQDCISDSLIYESGKYHNVIFIGKDENGMPRYAACRSISGNFKRDASGRDKRYSFLILAKEPTNSVHLFEATIDLLSYATYLKCQGLDYHAENLLSLSGVYQPQKNIKESKISVALSKFLTENPQVNTVILHLDNDRAGQLSTAALKEIMQDKWKIVDDPPPRGKDFNDFLRLYLGISIAKTSNERSL